MTESTEILNYFDIQIEQFPDRSARWLFEDKENVRGLLEIVATELVERVDFSQIAQINRSFVPDNLREQESDMVFNVPFQSASESEELLIYILIEHQSTVDSTMGFRLLFYMTQIWDSQRREWESEAVPKTLWRFCPILPIVFYTGAQRWNSPLTLGATMDIPDELGRFVPNFDTLFLSVKEADETHLTKTDHPLGWLLTVLQKEHADRETMSAALVNAMSHINELDEVQVLQRRRAISYLLLLILHRRPAEEHEELRTLGNQHIQEPSDREELETMAQTMAEHLVEQGEKRGEIRGEKRGEIRGEKRAKQEAVVKLLQSRFTEVPQSVVNQITAIGSASRLDVLFEKALTAHTLDEIGLQDHDS
ncbi:MAG: Rpn family recombination-promoting nuclease/putative transposase [Candidatus Poribacteria bacterium]|nr:Rpn family recombination-promoting nuclease/putative transposase [Candidatus Poribacteria bacterium]